MRRPTTSCLRSRLGPLIGAVLLSSGILCQTASAAPEGTVRGAERASVDLLRLREGGTKVYVQAELPDGEQGLFMVDTGAQMSVLNPSTALRLRLDATGTQQIVGVTGAASVQMADLDWVRLGDVVISHVEVAVGAPGQADVVAGVPIDGILGNNVWSHFVMDLDYRADTLTLHRAGSFRMPRTSSAMHFDGAHIHAPVQFVARSDREAVGVSWVAIDTGAHDLLFRGENGLAFTGAFSEGLEPIFGVTSVDGMPMSSYLQPTRRVAVAEVALGGQRIDVELDAVWMNWEEPDDARSWRGLAGHELFDGRRLLLDFQGGQFAVRKSRSRPDFHDARRLTLDRERARHGDAVDRALVRAGLHLALDEPDQALQELHALLDSVSPSLSRARRNARTLAARLHRVRGELDEARRLLASLGPDELVQERELVGVVNTLLLEGDGGQARRLAAEALDAAPEDREAWLAWSDVMLAEHDADGAQRALHEATSLGHDPNAHLLRRARVSLARGDRDAALAVLRDGVQLNPLDGRLLWFYARVTDAEDRDTLRSDLTEAMARVHPGMLPHDFLVGALSELGETDRALGHMASGIARDCDEDEGPSRDNCVAWYHTLAGHQLDAALERVDRAIAARGPRPDFLDTKAMVHLARGELVQARKAAVAAAKMSPEDPYMLWQADWLRSTTEDGQAIAR